MKNISQIKLSEFFSLFAPTYILGTTYTISLAFFESVVFPFVKKTNLERCLIICDKIGFQRVIEEAVALMGASQSYMAITAPSSFSFHPKVWLMINEEQVALMVGSGNLTQSGFMGNVELFDVIQIRKYEKGPKGVLEGIIKFLNGLRGLWKDIQDVSLIALDTLDKITKAVNELTEEVEHDEAERVEFITSFDGSIVERFPTVSEKSTLLIAAPYFGGSIKGVSLLQQILNPQKIEVFPTIHDGDYVDIPLADLISLSGVSASPLKLDKKKGFAHFKLYGCDDPHQRPWIFCGSPNCTEDALLSRNVEAGILRYVPRQLLYDYFIEDKRRKLPEKALGSDRWDNNGKRWFLCWATDLVDKIEVVPAPSSLKMVPLKRVSLNLSIGAKQYEFETTTLFGSNNVEKLSWRSFKDAKLQKNATPLFRLKGVRLA